MMQRHQLKRKMWHRMGIRNIYHRFISHRTARSLITETEIITAGITTAAIETMTVTEMETTVIETMTATDTETEITET